MQKLEMLWFIMIYFIMKTALAFGKSCQKYIKE